MKEHPAPISTEERYRAQAAAEAHAAVALARATYNALDVAVRRLENPVLETDPAPSLAEAAHDLAEATRAVATATAYHVAAHGLAADEPTERAAAEQARCLHVEALARWRTLAPVCQP